MPDRLTEQEIRIGLAEDMLDQVNLALFRQQQQIDLLQQEIRTLRQQMQASAPAEMLSLRDELPPHY